MESLSSFIGIDGTNPTLNSGRILINLKPLDVRKVSASDVIRRLQPELAKVEGISPLHAARSGPHRRCAREPDPVPVHPGRPRRRRALRAARPSWWRPCAAARAARREQRPAGSRGFSSRVDIDRSTASRLGIIPSDIDDALYDAYGQRMVSTIFTQLNQYRVILEVKPEYKQEPGELGRHLLRQRGRPGALSAPSTGRRRRRGPLLIASQGQFPVRDGLLQPATGRFPRRGGRGRQRPQPKLQLPAEHQRQLPGHGPGLQGLPGATSRS